MIRMIWVFGRTTDFVHVTNRIPRRPLRGKLGGNLLLFLCNVKSIERVEQNKSVILRKEKRLPLLPGRCTGYWRDGLYHDNPWSKAMPVPTQQNVCFGPLDIDL